MKNLMISVLSFLFMFATPLHAMDNDDPLFAKFMLDKFERAESDEDTQLVVEAEGWIGLDLHKLWIKSEMERSNGETEELETQVLYSRAMTSFWDFQTGIRTDWKPKPEQHWFALGFKGLAPYFLESDIHLFVKDSGLSSIRTSFEYELLLTQKLIFSPEIEANFYNKDDPDLGNKSGLNDVNTGLRIHYEFIREFSPYLGIERQFQFSATETHETKWVAGFKAWL